MSKIYITTAIPYVNGLPHIGHAMDYLIADTYARYQTQQGNTVRFQAGTDEHGNKIAKKAAELDILVEKYVTENSKHFQEFIKKLDVSVTDFIRTTDPEHERRCQEIWKKLEPHIYAATYEGWYCDGCESYVTDKEYKENNGVCPDHKKPYERLEEKNYYLKISDFKERIEKAIKSGEMLVLPEFRAKEMLALLKDSPDVSISRPVEKLKWGVPVPGDESQVMYVWIDALANYITVLGYPDKDISEFWPASVQFVGKDILRFHSIIWPAMLMALDLPLPKILHSHGHVLASGAKMSKSLGNTVDPVEVLESKGLPAFRYFFLRHIDTFSDSDFTWEKFNDAYNNELANDLGNLVQRLSNMCKKQELSGISDFVPERDKEFCRLMDSLYFSKAFDCAWEKVQEINKDIDESKPWEISKTAREAKLSGDVAALAEAEARLTEVLYKLCHKLLNVAYLLAPFLPETAKQINTIFTAKEIAPPETPLFPKDR